MLGLRSRATKLTTLLAFNKSNGKPKEMKPFNPT